MEENNNNIGPISEYKSNLVASNIPKDPTDLNFELISKTLNYLKKLQKQYKKDLKEIRKLNHPLSSYMFVLGKSTIVAMIINILSHGFCSCVVSNQKVRNFRGLKYCKQCNKIILE